MMNLTVLIQMAKLSENEVIQGIAMVLVLMALPAGTRLKGWKPKAI